METIGKRLRQAREERNLSLGDVQKALKIHPRILQALEDDAAHESVSTVYVRSFLRSYARYLGLDSDTLVEEYGVLHSERPEQHLHLEPTTEQEPMRYIKRYLPLAGKITAGVVALILLVFFVRGVWRFAENIKAKVPVTVEKPQTRRPVTTSKPKPKPAPPPAPLQPKKKTARVRKAPPPAPKPKSPPKPSLPIPKAELLTLIVKARDDVWMEVKSDGEILSRNVLTKGSVEAWNAKKKIELWVGKAEALELILNGVTLDPPGKGVKRGIVITHKGMKVPR
jgi:cytoskeletal protein RodZ